MIGYLVAASVGLLFLGELQWGGKYLISDLTSGLNENEWMFPITFPNEVFFVDVKAVNKTDYPLLVRTCGYQNGYGLYTEKITAYIEQIEKRTYGHYACMSIALGR